MAFEVVVAEPAETDLQDALAYLMERSPQAASQWFYGVQEAFLSLEEMPQRCAPIAEAGEFACDYRQLLVGSHRIIFRVEESANLVFVVRVWHGSRQPLLRQKIEVG